MLKTITDRLRVVALVVSLMTMGVCFGLLTSIDLYAGAADCWCEIWCFEGYDTTYCFIYCFGDSCGG